ncbi:hypothetical protein TrVGV298_004558 [Trichoderma virens]|nr:hypothetical protein TrVGV298_004558 [Trichoderma virens]
MGARHQYGLPALHVAAKLGYHIAVEMLLSNGADTEIRDKDGWKALHIAARFDRPMVAKVLLTHSADKETENGRGETPLMIAMRYGSQKTVNLLIVEGADVAAHDGIGNSVLSWAIASSLWPTVELLIAKGVTIEHGAVIAGGPMLHYVIEKEDNVLLDWLLKYSFNINYRDESSRLTPLHNAVAKGNAAIVSRLLEVDGIDAEAKTSDKDIDALTMALRRRNKEITRLLMDSGKVSTAFGSAKFFEFLRKSYH